MQASCSPLIGLVYAPTRHLLQEYDTRAFLLVLHSRVCHAAASLSEL